MTACEYKKNKINGICACFHSRKHGIGGRLKVALVLRIIIILLYIIMNYE